MNAIVSPITVIISKRVAEFSAILRFSGCASAVMASTERCTSTALSKPSVEPDTEEDADHHVAEEPAAAASQVRRRRHRLRAGASA